MLYKLVNWIKTTTTFKYFIAVSYNITLFDNVIPMDNVAFQLIFDKNKPTPQNIEFIIIIAHTYWDVFWLN